MLPFQNCMKNALDSKKKIIKMYVHVSMNKRWIDLMIIQTCLDNMVFNQCYSFIVGINKLLQFSNQRIKERA